MGSYYGAGTKPPMLIGQQDLGVKIKPYLTYDDPGGGNDTASNASDEDILSGRNCARHGRKHLCDGREKPTAERGGERHRIA